MAPSLRSFDLSSADDCVMGGGGSICFSHSSFSLRLLVRQSRPRTIIVILCHFEKTTSKQLWQLWVYFSALGSQHASERFTTISNVAWLGTTVAYFYSSLPTLAGTVRFGKWTDQEGICVSPAAGARLPPAIARSKNTAPAATRPSHFGRRTIR